MKVIRRIVIYLIISVFLFCLLPIAGADDDDNVLTSLKHKESGVFELTGNSRDITLAVRNSYDGTALDLINGLNITWNTSVFRSVVATPEAASIEINGTDTVELTVTYNRVSDLTDIPRRTEVYTIRAVRADPIDPSFTGTVSKTLLYSAANDTVAFTSADFLARYTKNEGKNLGSIAITGSNPSFGSIRVGDENYDLDTKPRINIDATNSANPIFTFEATSIGTVSYNITAYEDKTAPTPIGNVVLTVTSYTATPQIHTPIMEEVSKGTVKTFSESYFTSRCNLYNAPLESVEITPGDTSLGVWSLGVTPFTSTTTIPAAQLGNLKFTANATGTATFSWCVTTKPDSQLPSLTSLSGNGTFTITLLKLTLSPYNAGMQILRGGTWSQIDALTLPSAALFVKITAIPMSANGYLYLSQDLPKNDADGYPAITANKALTVNTVIPKDYLQHLCLATKSTSTNPAVFFSWTATADARVSSAVWADPVSYTVGFKSADSLPGNRPYYETDMNIPLPFTSETILSGIYDDIKTNFKAVTSYDLSYVTFKIPDKNCGTLLLNYDVIKKTGTSVSATTKLYVSKNPNLSKVTLVPAKDYTGAFEITYNAYTEGGSFITGQLEVKVNSNAGGTFSYVTDKNTPIQFDARDFQAAFLTATGKPLSYVRFSLPASSDGYLCYNYHLSGDYDSAVSSGSRYYVNTSQYLSYVTFVPSEDVTGRVIVYYTGYTENAYDYGGYSGKLYIDVADSPAGIVQYSVRENGSVMLTGGDFTEEFISVTGALLSHVTFTPPVASSGSLLFKYDADTETGTKVTSAVKYYDGRNPDISDITFMPAKDFTGTCVVPFTAYTAGGASYAGKLKFNIFEGSDVISYTTGAGKPVSMNSSDFMSAFYMNSGGKTLSYVTFELPSASYGRFYYNYTSPARYDEAVAVSRKYYVSGTPYLSNVSFVPQEGYTGSFSIAYTGYTSGGISCAGKIKITVSGAAGGAVSYETNSMTPVTFKAADFVAAFTGKTGNPLYYVRFTQPNASFGTLYEQYNPQLSYNTQVTPSKSYYVNYPTYISNVTFIPNAGFSGTLAIGYTAYDTYGYSSAGTILITVSSSELGTITYGTGMNMPVPFDANNFNTVFLNKTGATLSHVTFTLPPSSAGSLYFRYNTGAASSVTSSTKYYRSYSPLLSDISFVPRTDYSGSVTIPYMGYTAGNAAFSGKIVINVGTVAPYTDMGGHTWAQDAVDYLYSNGVIADNGSRYFYPGADMTRGEYMVMIANAFHLTGAGSGTFPDVPVGSPYYDAVAAAKAYDIARGDDTGLFRPEWGLTRQDAMVIIVRAFKNTGTPLTPGTIGDLAGFSDASLVSDYAVADLAALVRIGFVVGSGDRLNPKVTFSRAEAAVLLYRILIM